MSTHSRSFLTGLLALLLAALTGLTMAQAQAPGVTSQPLGFGRAPFATEVGGPADIALARITLEPGRGSGWHSHVGPGWVVVTAGTLSVYRLDGCQTDYPTGTAFLEEPGEVHEARNDTTEPVEFLISFTLPAGVPLLVQEGPSTGTCR
jgi:quercetin dioxygenase-like cupin family protein